MKNILRIDSSLFLNNSVSQQLAQELIAELTKDDNNIKTLRRNIAKEGVPHLDSEWVTALATPAAERSPAQQDKVSYSDQLIKDVQQANILVIGAPMYNFNVPSTLKSWFDHIARAGVTFSYTSDGPQGLLTNKTAYIITTRGGMHKDKSTDTMVPFIKNYLAFIGITDVNIIYAEGLNMGAESREAGLTTARASISALLAA